MGCAQYNQHARELCKSCKRVVGELQGVVRDHKRSWQVVQNFGLYTFTATVPLSLTSHPKPLYKFTFACEFMGNVLTWVVVEGRNVQESGQITVFLNQVETTSRSIFSPLKDLQTFHI